MRLVNGLDAEATSLLIEALATCGSDGRTKEVATPRVGATSVQILATRIQRGSRPRKVELFRQIAPANGDAPEPLDPTALSRAIAHAENFPDWSTAPSTIGRKGEAAKHLGYVLGDDWVKASLTVGAPGLAPAIRADLAHGTRTIFVDADLVEGMPGDLRALPRNVALALTDDALHLRTPDPAAPTLEVHLGTGARIEFERPDAIELLRQLRAAQRASDA